MASKYLQATCAWLLASSATFACQDSSQSASVPDARDEGQADSDAEPGTTCTTHQLPRNLEFEFAGITRATLLAGPEALPTKPLALVLNFHGYSDGPEEQEGFSLMSDHALQEGYVVAYPRGTGAIKGWNAGACCGTAASSGIDDVAFAEALIDEIAAIACIDRERVYAVGYSNGGFLSHRLACELSNKISGIASVAGVMGMSECNPSRSIPVMQIHGTADAIVPYAGNVASGFPSVDATMEAWRTRLGCSAVPITTYSQGDATCVAWEGCNQPLARCTIDGGGHTWPGGTAPVIRGKLSTDLDATAAMWDFFTSATP